MLKHLQPQLGAVFWDEGLPQRRVELQPAYKETRKEMPGPMIPQLDFIRSTITPLLGFTNIALPDTEADDLMGFIQSRRAGTIPRWCWRQTTKTFISSWARG